MAAVRITRSLFQKLLAFLILIAGFFSVFFMNAPGAFHRYNSQSSVAHADGPNSCGTGFSCTSCPGECIRDCVSTECDGEDDATGDDCDGSDCDGDGEGGAEGGGGGDGGGGSGKIICAELFRQGLLPLNWYEADERFGRMVSIHVLEGYQLWARHIVRMMRRSRMFTGAVYVIAKPWAKHMAFRMGVVEEDSFLGAILMAIGVSVCGILGHVFRIFRLCRVVPRVN